MKYSLQFQTVIFYSLHYAGVRWEDNFKMELQGVGCGGMDFIELAHREMWRALVTAVIDLRVP
jgi:hypothetical protein